MSDVLIDVDGTVAALVPHTLVQLAKIHKPSTLPKFEELESSVNFFGTDGPLSSKQLANAYELMGNSEFVQSLPVIADALEGVRKIRRAGHSAIFLTASWLSSKTWDYDRRLWLERKFQAKPTSVIFAHEKFRVRGDVLIEDTVEKAEPWQRENPAGLVLLHDQPANRGQGKQFRRFCWADIGEILKMKEFK